MTKIGQIDLRKKQMNVEKKIIKSGIPEIKHCPKCFELTCFILPRFDPKTRDIIEYACAKCLSKEKR